MWTVWYSHGRSCPSPWRKTSIFPVWGSRCTRSQGSCCKAVPGARSRLVAARLYRCPPCEKALLRRRRTCWWSCNRGWDRAAPPRGMGLVCHILPLQRVFPMQDRVLCCTGSSWSCWRHRSPGLFPVYSQNIRVRGR